MISGRLKPVELKNIETHANIELDSLNEYWDAMPGLREDIFRNITPEYVGLRDADVERLIKEHPATQKYKVAYAEAFADFRSMLSERLFKNHESINSQDEEEQISNEIFRRMNSIKVIDPYEWLRASERNA